MYQNTEGISEKRRKKILEVFCSVFCREKTEQNTFGLCHEKTIENTYLRAKDVQSLAGKYSSKC